MHETKLCVTIVRAKSHCQPFVYLKRQQATFLGELIVLLVLFVSSLFWTTVNFNGRADLHNEIKVGCIIKNGLRGEFFNRLWATATDSAKALATNKATAKEFVSAVTTPSAFYTAIQQSSSYNKENFSTNMHSFKKK
ncbi:hypothetical protein CHUAL_011310 [Chamberlinius hualienensis]